MRIVNTLIVLLGLLFISPQHNFAQENGKISLSPTELKKREKLYKKIDKQLLKNRSAISSGRSLLKGQNGNISSLESSYCSTSSSDNIVPDKWETGATDISWDVYTKDTGGDVSHPDWYEIQGTGTNTVLVFYPDRVTSNYFGKVVVFEYTQTDGIGSIATAYDYTYVYQTPTAFNLSPANSVICGGDSTNLTLSSSEDGMEYFLYRDGVEVSPVPISGDGNQIIFKVYTAGDYTVEARNSSDNNCSNTMNGTATVVVNPKPTITAGNDSPVCEGDLLNLTSAADNGTPAYEYSWTGPAGFTSTAQNPTIADVTTGQTGQYTVTVVDSKGCSNSTNTDVVVNENPVVVASSDGPPCENGTLTLSTTVTGGLAPYSYSWTGPDGFTSTEPNPVINNITLAKAGVYSVTVTDANNCGSTTASTTVVVNKLPVVAPANDGPVCEFGTLQLTAGSDDNGSLPYTFSWTGPAGFSSTAENPSITNIALTQAGDYSVVATDQTGCLSIAALTTVVVNDAPVAVASNNGPVCEGGTLILTGSASEGTGTYTYTWTGPAGFNATGATVTINNIALSQAGTYTLTVNDGNCTDVTTTDVVVNANPTVKAANDGPVCENGILTLSSTPNGGTGPYTFSWSGPGTYSSTDQNPVINNITQAQAGTYQVNIIDANGCANVTAASTDVVVNENPTVVAANDGPVCEDETLHLGSSPNGGDGVYTYSWTGPAGFTSTAKDPVITNIQLSQSGNYDIVVTDGNTCSSAVATTTVIVNDAPVASASNDGPVCEGGTLTLSGGATEGTGTYTFNWSGPNGFTSNQQNPVINHITLADAGIYTLTVDDGNCSNTTTTTVVVNANPTITAANDGPVCEKSVLHLTSNPSGGSGVYTFAWTGPVGFTSTVQNPVIDNVTTANGGIYNVVVTDNNGCSNSALSTTSVTVHPSPTVSAASNSPLCKGETLNLTADGNGGTNPLNYSWTGPQGYTSTTQNPVLTNILVDQSGDYEVIVSDANSCTDTSLTTVIVNKVTATISASNGAVICEGTPITFNARAEDGSGNYKYDFHVVRGVNDVSVINSGSRTWTVDTLSNNDKVYVIVIDNNTLCTDQSASIFVVVRPNPVVELKITSGNDTICSGTLVEFTADPGYANYVYYVDGDIAQSGNNNVYRTDTLTNNQKVSVNVTSADGCSSSTPAIEMTVYDTPVAQMTATPGTNIIEGTNVTFTATGGTTYEFFVNGIEVQPRSNDNTYESSTLANGVMVSVNVYGDGDCVSTATLEMTVKEGIAPVDVYASATEYCLGEAGVSIYLQDPQAGITYDLIRESDNTVIGTITYDGSNTVKWDDIKGTETYRVEGYYLSLPADRVAMNNTITVVENPLPAQYDMTPIGEKTGCNSGNGYEIKLVDSDVGYKYQLLINGTNIGAAVAGTGDAISFGANINIGLYSVLSVNDITGCSKIMNGTFEIKSDDTYNRYDVSGDGEYCTGEAGASVTLEGSDIGVEYHVLVDGADINVSWTADVDTGHKFGPFTVEGNYTVVVSSASGCTYPMNGSVNVVAVPLPQSFDLVADNDGHFCEDDPEGVEITISGQQKDILYNLYRDGVLVKTDTGKVDDANMALSFGKYNIAGQYSVIAVSQGKGCAADMNNEVKLIADPLPVIYDVTNDGNFCAGSVTYLHLSGSESDVQYRWERDEDGNSGAWITGNGGMLDFEITGSGTYYIVGQRTGTTTACAIKMNGRYYLTEKPNPDLTKTLRIKAGTGLACDNGAVVIVESGEPDVVYKLYKGYLTGNTVTGAPDTSDVEFAPVVDVDATYQVIADKNGCVDFLNANIYINVPGAIKRFGVTGSGDICNGDPGVQFGLDGSETGVTYKLYLVDGNGTGNDKQIGDPIVGTGTAITFDLANEEGSYYVIGDDGVGCTIEMTNRVTLTVNPLPVAFRMTGSGFFCDDNDGAEIGLNGQEYSVKYILQYDDGSGNRNRGEATGGTTNDSIVFGKYIDEGLYTVIGITDKGCTSNMNGDVTVSRKSAPVDYRVLSTDTAYCSNEPGVELFMEHSESNVVYAIYNEFNVLVSETDGTGADKLSLGMVTSGTYIITGAYGGDACETPMNGGKSVIISEFDTPVKFHLSASSSNICGSQGNDILLDGSENGRYYYLLENGINANDTIIGGGGALTWTVYASGADTIDYEVIAISGGHCDLSMGSVEVIYKSSPVKANIITKNDTKQYCSGMPGIVIGIDTSEVNIGYQLLDNLNNIVDFVLGTGDTTFFNNPHNGNRYTVKAIDFNSGCFTMMNDTITIVENPMPKVYKMFLALSDGSTSECEYQCTGLINVDTIKLEMSQDYVDYLLWMQDVDGNSSSLDTIRGTFDEISFGAQTKGGSFRIEGVTDMGCRTFMNGSAYLYQSPLIAKNDIMNFGKGELIGKINVTEDNGYGPDLLLKGIDSLDGPNKNIMFTLDPSWVYVDELGSPQTFSTIGSVSINESGDIEYSKLPSFYGRDSVRYIIRNVTHPERSDTATVFIFIGNTPINSTTTFLIPNAFSPNGDGINDRFVITGIDNKEESKLEVFNRWGTLVYRSSGQNYDNNWDGKSTEASMVHLGDDLPNGTYFYVFSVKINIEGKIVDKEYSGYIELRR